MGRLGRLYARYQNYVLSRQKACGDRAGIPNCRDGDPRDVSAGTWEYRRHFACHMPQHISYFVFGYDNDEPRPRIEKGDFILAARERRLAQEVAQVPSHGEMYEGEGLPVAEAVEDPFEKAVRKRMAQSSMPVNGGVVNSSRLPFEDRPY